MIIDCFNTSTAVSVYHLHAAHFVVTQIALLGDAFISPQQYIYYNLIPFAEQLDQRPLRR